jgi:hypothetical protein
MSKKENKKVEDAAETYGITPKNEETSKDLHPVLVKLLEKSKKNHDLGHVFSHEEAMGLYKEKTSTK